MKKQALGLVVAVVSMSLSLFAADPVINSVSIEQRPLTKLVDITYSVTDPDGDPMLISVVGKDTDTEESIPMTTLSGDGADGERVASGTHTLTWDAGTDHPDVMIESFSVVLTANDAETTASEGFVLIDAGTTPGNYVTVSEPFYISKYEATNAQVADVLQWAEDNDLVDVDSGSVKPKDASEELLDLGDGDCQISWNGSAFEVDSGKENYPCVEITWYGATAYCNYLSAKEGYTPAYDLSDWTLVAGADGFRLPTDDQWEYAARGGRDGNDTDYSGSGNLDEVGWYSSNSGSHSHEVGTKDANELDIYDMSGNVWEWCHDWYPGYEGSYRVGRGGSWYSSASGCRVSCRDFNSPGFSYYTDGFRPALPAGQ